jgi:putative redox protein
MTVSISVTYAGQLRCELIHGPSSTSLQTDAPKDNEGKGESFSPTDLVGAALLSCAVTTMAIKGRKEGIDFPTARGTVTKEMANAPRKIARLAVEIDMPPGLDAAARARLEEIGRTCPVALSLANDVIVEMTFRYAP